MNASTRKLIGFIAAGLLIAAVGCDKSSGDTTTQKASATAATASDQSPMPAPSESNSTTTSANAEHYDVRSAQQAIEVGKKAKVELAITPSDGLKINKEFPWKLEFSDTANVQLAQKAITGAQIDLDESEATFPVMLEASAAGEHKLAATGDFSVCNDTKCYSIRGEALEFTVEAKQAGSEQADDTDAAEQQKP